MADGELLETFAAGDGEAAEGAFAALVERHGPMVLKVCRQVLRDGHAAEDAFQAAFLVLARKGRSLQVSHSLAPWLFQVAWRTASRLRVQLARRVLHETKAAAAAAAVVPGGSWDDLPATLHEEIGHLPARYRVPLVLCYLEGLTALEVARQLGWAPGTVRSRLARGRQRLRARLSRRGLALSSATIVAALAAKPSKAAVPATLADATTRAASLVAAGGVPVGVVPATVLTLTEGVLQTMTMTKLKLMATVLAVGLATTALALAQSGGGRGPEQGALTKSADDRIVGENPYRRGGQPPETAKTPAESLDYAGDTPAGAGRSQSAADSARLQAVERKLDRILQALGASGPEERRDALNTGQPREEVAHDPFTASTKSSPREPAGDMLDATGPVGKGPRATTVRDLSGIQARLGRVERTLADLVDRVRRLEGHSPKMPDGNWYRDAVTK
jgi:RNA polymerase sigma factor (sigma-70 family)